MDGRDSIVEEVETISPVVMSYDSLNKVLQEMCMENGGSNCRIVCLISITNR